MSKSISSSSALRYFTRWVEYVAGVALAVITLLAFATVVMRYFFAKNVPDGIEVGGLLLAISTFLGMALACLRGEHITVDLVWSILPLRGRRVLDILASVVTLGAISCFAWMIARQAHNTMGSGLTTYDLALPVWPFYVASALAVVMAMLLQAIHLVSTWSAESAIAADGAFVANQESVDE